MWLFPDPNHPASPWTYPSFPAAILMGLFCSYIWSRIKPFVHRDPGTTKQDYILQDLSHATSFLASLHDTLFPTSKSASSSNSSPNTESISKAGEDVLLQRTASHTGDGRRRTSESITGTLTMDASDKKEVSRLRRKMRSMGEMTKTKKMKGELQVWQVGEAGSGRGLVLLQARMPVTSRLLNEAFEIGRRAVAVDPRATLQLGSYGIIMKSEGEVKLLRLEDGDVPVLLDSFCEEDDDLRVEGLFLRGVQMKATIGDKGVVLRSKTLLKDEGGWSDALVVWPPLVALEKASLLYATKIVEFKGVTATVRSNVLPVSFNRKPKDEDHTGLYLAAALAFIVALMPSAFWLPVLGQIGVLFLPLFQIGAVIVGWNLGHFLLLGEWPSTGGDREVKLDSEDEMKDFGLNLYKYTSPWDSAVRMEMGDLQRQLAQKLESQPSVSNAGIFGQQADYRTEFWRKGVAEMDQAIEIEPENELPFRIRGCIKGLAGDYEGAFKDLDEALRLKPKDVLALVDRGIFRFLCDDLVGALADLNEAIKQDPALPPEILKLRDSMEQILADREELAKLRDENPKLKAELDALRAKAASDLEAAQAKAAADLASAEAKAAADLESLRTKSEAEAADLKAQNQKLQEDLHKAQDTLRSMPSNQTLELQYNNLCCEKCVRDIKAALSKVPGVESVSEDFMEGKVTVTGYVSAAVVLSVCRQTSPKKVIYLVGDEVPQAYAAVPRELEEHETESHPAPAPAETPETAHETTTEAAPTSSPEAPEAPEAAPAQTPEAVPEAIPEATPEPAPAPAREPEPAADPAPKPSEDGPEPAVAKEPTWVSEPASEEVPAVPAPPTPQKVDGNPEPVSTPRENGEIQPEKPANGSD